jgi:ribosomal protein S16
MTDPSTIELKEDRVRERIEAGAQTSDVVAKIIKEKIPGLLEERSEKQLSKLQEQRKARKARSKGKEKKVSEAKAKKKAKKAKSKKVAA